MRFLRYGLLALCLTSGLASAQEIYRWTDKDGKLHFTDTPPPPTESKNVTSKQYKGGGGDSEDMPYSVREAIKRNPVTLYANDCGEVCDKARALLSKRGIPATIKNPQTDPAAGEALKSLTGSMTVPFLLVGSSSVSGFADGEWQALLDAAGYPRTNPGLKPPKPAPKAETKPSVESAERTPASTVEAAPR